MPLDSSEREASGSVGGGGGGRSLIDRCMGLDAGSCAAEFFTLGLMSGMCVSRD